jgi:Protein of unknown function (DUF3047)
MSFKLTSPNTCAALVNTVLKRFILGSLVLTLWACAQAPQKDMSAAADTETSTEVADLNSSPKPAAQDIATSAWAQSSSMQGNSRAVGETWAHQTLPGKRANLWEYVQIDGRHALHANASSSVSVWRHKVSVNPQKLGRLSFSWKKLEQLLQSDMAVREKDDAPLRVVLAFDGDRSRLSAKTLMLSELSRLLTGEDLPYATMMYVWCHKRPVGSVIENPRTDRIRKLVIETGTKNLGQWSSHDRDIKADFEKVFGEAPGELIGVGVMTDTDNTRSKIQAWYGPIELRNLQP